MKPNENITLRRDCEAAQVPSGQKMMLPKGTQVRITQSLGGTYTVLTHNGYLARIAGKDADALGEEAPVVTQTDITVEGPEDLEQLVWAQLRTCFDPEIPVNIVDLGLVYHCQAIPLPQGGNKVEVKFTLTAPGCGMGTVLQADMESKILGLPDVKNVDVEVVFDPPWNQTMMSEAAKLELGML
ncbi:MAG: putative Fe-S cluster assembly protein SufT [Candidatus Binatia bacterium]